MKMAYFFVALVFRLILSDNKKYLSTCKPMCTHRGDQTK